MATKIPLLSAGWSYWSWGNTNAASFSAISSEMTYVLTRRRATAASSASRSCTTLWQSRPISMRKLSKMKFIQSAPALVDAIGAALHPVRRTLTDLGHRDRRAVAGRRAVAATLAVSVSTAGLAGGFDYRLTPDSVVGFALAGGGTNWSLSQGMGGGKSDGFQAGLYGATKSGPAYLAAALAFTNHWMSTDRLVLGDRLTADFNAELRIFSAMTWRTRSAR
jgi:hypothetical protein